MFLALKQHSNICPFFFFYNFHSAGRATCTWWHTFSFLLINTRSSHLAGICWSVCISKFQKILLVSFSWTDCGLCIQILFAWLDFKLLPNSQWITFLTQSCLVLHFFLCQYAAFNRFQVNLPSLSFEETIKLFFSHFCFRDFVVLLLLLMLTYYWLL